MNSKVHQLTENTKSDSQINMTIAKFPIFLVTVALLFLCSVCTPTNAAPTNDGSTIKITYPSNASLVNIQETVTGTAGNIPEEQKLWILIYPLTANKFYPQSGNVNVINGEWSLTVGIGTKDNVGETFKIIAVLADQQSNEELTNYINTGPSTGWPGMVSVPIGAKVVDEVTVTRLNPEINITYPSNTTSVNMQETVNGTAKNIPSEYKVWILVHPLATTKLYPQHGNVNIINGKWSIPIGIGNKENVGEAFEIMAVLANQKAHEELTNYINTGKNTNNWPGMDGIPDGANVYKEVTVIRKIEPMVIITSPLNTAKLHDTITGTAKYIPEGQAVWILIYPQTANKYYPQNKVDTQNENWVLQAQFGLENNDSEKFDIIAVLADQNAQNEFTAYLDKSNAVQKWDGIQALPNVTKELARVTVTRIGETVPSPSSSDGGSSGGSSHSSGGGGAGGSPEPQSNVQVKELSQTFIANGKPVKFDFTKNATCVVYVGFDAIKNVGKTTTTAEQLKNKSALVPKLPGGEVYKSFNVWVGNSGYATSKNIEKPVLCFKVEKSWLQNESIERDSITLNRYEDEDKHDGKDGTWTQLPASLTGEDNKYLYFTSEVSGYASFAITGISKDTSEKLKGTSEHKPASLESNISLSSSSDSFKFGKSVMFTAIIRTPSQGTEKPSGTVTFMDGDSAIGTENLSSEGQVTLNSSSLSVGSHSVTAQYNGDNNYKPSISSSLMIQVKKSGLGEIKSKIKNDLNEILKKLSGNS